MIWFLPNLPASLTPNSAHIPSFSVPTRLNPEAPPYSSIIFLPWLQGGFTPHFPHPHSLLTQPSFPSPQHLLAWKIPWMEEPGRLHPWGRKESDITERLHFDFSLSCIGKGNGNPLQCSWLENPRDGGAWWAAVSGVAQSRTRLKWLSSSSSISLHSGTFPPLLLSRPWPELPSRALPHRLFPLPLVLSPIPRSVSWSPACCCCLVGKSCPTLRPHGL